MYRQRPEQQGVETEEEKHLFVSRLLHLPVVATAMDQVNTLYSTTKQRNSLIKRTMETAETGVSAVFGTAAPVISMFDKPFTSLNDFACDQLDKLENKYPIITKPTEEVVKATKDLCNTAVKPFVDRVSSAKQYGYDRVSNIRSFTGEKLDDMKTYGWTTVESVVQLGNDQVARVLTTVSHHRLLSMDDFLETADRYVDSYLPPDQEEDEAKEKEGEKEGGGEEEGGGEKDGGGEKKEDGKATSSTVVVSKAFQLGSKVQKRLWSQALKQVKRVELRSRETLQKLNFTVDLIEYARTNFNEAKDKVESIWNEVNKTEEEIAKEETEEEKTKEKKKSALERRAIATARQLTLRLKSTLSWLNIPHFAIGSIPEVVTGQIQSLQQKTQSLVDIFSKEVADGKELTESALGRARNLSSQIYSGVLGLVSSLARYGGEKKELTVKVETKSEEELKPGSKTEEKDDQLSTNSQEDN